VALKVCYCFRVFPLKQEPRRVPLLVGLRPLALRSIPHEARSSQKRERALDVLLFLWHLEARFNVSDRKRNEDCREKSRGI